MTCKYCDAACLSAICDECRKQTTGKEDGIVAPRLKAARKVPFDPYFFGFCVDAPAQ